MASEEIIGAQVFKDPKNAPHPFVPTNPTEAETGTFHPEADNVAPDNVQEAGEVDPVKPDSTESIKLARKETPISDHKAKIKAVHMKILEQPNAAQLTEQLARHLTTGSSLGNSNIIPGISSFVTTALSLSNTKTPPLQKILGLIQSINQLTNFQQLDTGSVKHFMQLLHSVPGTQGLDKLPYFRSHRDSIGSSLILMTDLAGMSNTAWINNAAKSMGQTSPVAMLSRSKIFSPLLKEVDKGHDQIIQSLQTNLVHMHSGITGFLSQFGGLMGFLPKEITQIVGMATQTLNQIQGIAGQVSGAVNSIGSGGGDFIGQILGALGQISNIAHGLDMIVDVKHLQNIQSAQKAGLNILMKALGDEVRMVSPLYPIKKGVKLHGNTYISNHIHGFKTRTTGAGDKTEAKSRTDEDLLPKDPSEPDIPVEPNLIPQALLP